MTICVILEDVGIGNNGCDNFNFIIKCQPCSEENRATIHSVKLQQNYQTIDVELVDLLKEDVLNYLSKQAYIKALEDVETEKHLKQLEERDYLTRAGALYYTGW